MRRGASVAAALAVLISSVAIAASAIAGSNANELYPLLPMGVSTVGGLKAEKKTSNRLFTSAEVASVTADTAVVASESSVSTAGGRLVFGGFDQPTEKATHLLLYVKVPTANVITLTVKMRDDYASSSVPNLVLKAKVAYQVMPLGGKWSDAKTANSGTGALKFDKAFEGYVKIPLSSFKDDASGANVAAVLTEIDYMTGLEARFAGVGGKYGTIEMLPYLVVADNGSTSFKIADDYVAPTSNAVQVTPVTNLTLNKWAMGVNLTEVSPLSFTKAIGSKISGKNGKETYLENNDTANGVTYNDGQVILNSKGNPATGQLYSSFSPVNLSLADTTGLVFYVKVDAANLLDPGFNINRNLIEKSRWRYSYDPDLFLGVGYTYQYMSIDGGDWKTGVAVAGNPEKTAYGSIHGAIKFDGAFEGYIKIPYNSLVSDSGFIFCADLDTIQNIYFKLVGAGGKYGEPVVGPLFTVDKEGSTGLELTTPPEPVKATPISGWTTSTNWWEYNVKTEVTPLDFTTAKGLMTTYRKYGDTYPEYWESEFGSIQTSRAYIGFNFAEGSRQAIAGSDGLIFYVKTESANDIFPVMTLINEETGKQGEYHLMVGKLYYYSALGSDTWETGTVGAGGKTGSDYHGTIGFDGPFEGYVKIPYSSMGNDNRRAMDTDVDKIVSVGFLLRRLGGEFGTVTVGPVMLITEDSDSTQIQTPSAVTLKDIDAYASFTKNSLLGRVTNNINYDKVDITTGKLTGDGVKITSSEEYVYGPDGTASLNSAPALATVYSSNQDLSGTSGFVFYVKVDKANQISPEFSVDPQYGWGGAYLYAGKSYYIAKLTDTEWKEAKAGKGQKTEESAYGTIALEEGFEGYVKIPYTSLYNSKDKCGIGTFTGDTGDLTRVWWRATHVGNGYSYTVGKIYLVKNDGGSADFEIVSDTPVITDPINVTPVDGSYTASGMIASETALKPVALKAAALSSDKGTKSATVTFTAKSATAASGAGLLAYVSVPEKSSLAIKLGDKAVAGGKKLALLKKDGNTWSTVTTESDGTVYFKSAFTGYVRIPFEAVSGFNTASDKIATVELKLTSDSKFESATLGGISLYDINSESAELNFPEEYFTTVKDKVDFILNNSKNGITQANYFLVGDSTRHQHGYPLFRLLRDVLKNDYNVNCRIQALSGLKTAYWSGVEPELQNTGVTVDGLIKIIPGTGENCIVDIALGINDSDKSLDEMVKYYTTGVKKLRDAKPDVTVIFTSPNMLDSSNEKRLSEYVAKLSTIDTHYTIDAHNNVMSEPFAGYYDDGWHPNIDGYRAMASYIKSCLFEGYTYTKIEADEVELDTSVALPANATLNTSTLTASNKHYLDASASGILVGGQRASVFSLSGSTVTDKEYVYSSTTFVETTLSNDLVGNDYLTFYVSLPAANQLGVTCFIKGTKDAEGEKTKECIFKNAVGYQILPDGETEWQKCTSVDGRTDGSETYGAIKFDSEFSGFIRIPLSNFYGGPSSSTPINRVTVRFSQLGGEYGSVTLGAFLNMNEEPYIAKTVWKKSDLPEMTPFTDMIGLDGHWGWVTRSNVASPIPELNASNKASVKITCIPTADYGVDGFMKSVHWCGAIYDNMPIGDFTHLVFYVKVPKTKENYLSICMFTETHFEFKVMVNMPYQTMTVNENKWQHHTAFKTINQYGGIELPAGFEGLIKVPIDSLLPANKVDKDTVIAQIHYRFAYNGADDDTVLVGPVFGVTKDNDEGPAETILTALPEKSTVKSLYAVDKDDIFTDRVMLYWQEYPETDHYLIEAYEIITENGEKSYKLISTTKTFTNSGTALGLEAKTKYAFVIKAYDYDERLLAVYDYITVTTAEKDPYAIAGMSDEFTLDPVYYPGGEKADTATDNGGVNLPLVIGISAGAAVLVAAGVLVVLFVKKRRS